MIVIYGATGLAGKLITKALLARGAKVALAGRDRDRLTAFASELDSDVEVRVAAVHQRAKLEEAFADAKVVIGCAGPFVRLGEPVLGAAIAASAHYVDISSEQDFLRESYESFEAAAHRAGVVCVSGLAFRGALGDWAAALAHQSLGEPSAKIAKIDIGYAISKPQLTARERASAALALSSPTLIWRRDRWEPLAPGAVRKRFGFGGKFGDHEAVLFGGSEVISVPRHLDVEEVRTFLWIETKNPLTWEATRLAPYLAPVLGPLARGVLGRFMRAQADAASPNESLGDNRADFSIVATASAGFEQSRVAITGSDPYRLTAEICSAGALALASRGSGSNAADRPAEADEQSNERSGRPASAGILTPAQVFDPRARLFSLAARELISVEQS